MIKFFGIIGIILISSSAFAQKDSLKQKIEEIISTKKADVGISIYGIESKDSLSINGNKHYPMQSVFKFHIALKILNLVDNGKLMLQQKVFIKKSDLLPNTWSPIREDYPEGNINLPLSEILKYTVSQSDNNGCDILLNLIGGPKIVNDYIHNLGIKDISIQANEEEMHKDWNIQFLNWTTPNAASDLLLLFFKKKILSKSSFDFLWKIMTETTTGKNAIKGQLPEGTLVAHKTGSSGVNDQGITAAANDIGIVKLPNGKHFIISIFVSNSKENFEANQKIISDIAKAAWDYFVNKQ